MAEVQFMKNVKFLNNKLSRVAAFLEEQLALANCHTVHFITQNYWTKYINPTIQNELLQLSYKELTNVPSGRLLEMESDPEIVLQTFDSFCELDLLSLKHHACKLYPNSPLKQHIWLARQHTLPFLGMTNDSLVSDKHSSTFKNFMSPKKCHEVEVMADVVKKLANQYDISQVVDIGSGKGYLSSILALQYKLHVLGIDSSSTNTHSAALRSSKILKYWQGFENLQNGLKMSKNIQQKNPAHKPNKIILQENVKKTKDSVQNLNESQSVKCKDTLNNERYLPVTQFVNSSTNLEKLLLNNGFLLENFIITGLHTCGNLASSVIQLFISNSLAKILCNVGCCYNYIEEQFCRSPFFKEADPIPTEFGFPLSSSLQSQKITLGRNARMLACLPPERMAEDKKNFSSALFYRALLQVILRDKLGKDGFEFQVGKLAPKCNNFVEYVQKAIKKLNLTLQISSEEIEKYFHDYIDYEKKMIAFFYFRATLSSCIESFILADRLCYLHEQDVIASAHLVPMFDPTASPRCYGLVAIKK